MLAGMDPKMLAGLDPKMLAGLDTKMLAGLDPKMLIGLDSKALQSLGLDPKIVASLIEQQNPAKSGAGATTKPPKTISTAKISTSVTPTFSSLESRVSTTAASASSNP